MPGWTRVRHGRGFRYLDENGEPLAAIDIERCKKLVIPPAWTEVWICPVDNGHLQAVGTDDAGRRQYLYHPAWRERRDRQKFEQMEEFADALLRRRAVVRRHLSADDLGLRHAQATAFALLDLGVFRIGSERYTEEYGSFGLTTVLREHVRRRREGIVFTYTGKSGQEINVTVRDPRIIGAVDPMLRRRTGGDQLLAWRDRTGWHSVAAEEVNTYIKEVLHGDFTAKDFRTWRGTVIAALALAHGDVRTKTSRKRSVTAAMREVSEHLGNTPAVARSSYVDPRVVDLFENGITVSRDHRMPEPGQSVAPSLEREVLGILDAGP
ncbi:DNA topoisomerase IB [Aeromicrobium camelliae]|uniref:DNA topoisomerase n=1 Tax=Aeromicrobium camelliae TaxID=1538144 RepID=A0A3N6ZS13_9ACTN|nr:DNA topoisomerase IB [Aeromicrobium camelliae]RQN09787.1 DNA topoisomerase IB [Aeromicrobium camelliae]